MALKTHSQRKGYTIIKSFSISFKVLNILENYSKYNCKNSSDFLQKAVLYFYERNKNINERINDLRQAKKELVIQANEIADEIKRLEDALAMAKQTNKEREK